MYMAPEIFHGLGYDKKADIYSIGLIFLEMLTGTKPWQGQKSHFFYDFSNGKINLADYGVHVSKLCLDLLQKMIQREPEKRIGFNEFFEHPVVSHEPAVYRQLVEQYVSNPRQFMKE